MAIQRFKLDLVPGRSTPRVHVSQYDEGADRSLYAEIYWEGVPFLLPTQAAATIHGTNRRGHGFDDDCEIITEDGHSVVIIEPTLAMTYVDGPVRCKVNVANGTSSIGTGAFTLDVDTAGRKNETPVITDAQNVLDVNAAINMANAAKTAAETAYSGAAASEAAALAAKQGAEEAAAAVSDAAQVAEDLEAELAESRTLLGEDDCELETEVRADGAVSIKHKDTDKHYRPAVLFTQQTLDPDQKAQARKNIGIIEYITARRIQDMLRNIGSSAFRLAFVDEKTGPADAAEPENYYPRLVFWNGLHLMTIFGDFKTLRAYRDSDSETNRALLTGLPAIGTARTLQDCLTWYDTTNAQLRTASAVYSPSGTLRFRSPDGFTIPSGTAVHIDAGVQPTFRFGGEMYFPTITDEDISNAAAWIRHHRGLFEYDENRAGHMDALDGMATDCSGLIFNAFFHDAVEEGGETIIGELKKRVPSSATCQGGFGEIVGYYPPGQLLEIDETTDPGETASAHERAAAICLSPDVYEEGDLVFYIRPAESFAHHVAIVLNDGTASAPALHLWHQGTSFTRRDEAEAPTLGPQPIRGTYSNGSTVSDASYRSSAEARLVVRWKNHLTDLYGTQ